MVSPANVVATLSVRTVADEAALTSNILVSSLALQAGAFVHAVANVTVQEVITPVPIVTFPAPSLPTILGAVPHDDTTGLAPPD